VSVGWHVVPAVQPGVQSTGRHVNDGVQAQQSDALQASVVQSSPSSQCDALLQSQQSVLSSHDLPKQRSPLPWHRPELQALVSVQYIMSSHGSTLSACTQRPNSSQASSVHGLPSLHVPAPVHS
jgi:hypothetical protein